MIRIGIHNLWIDSDPNWSAYYSGLIKGLGSIDQENDYTVYYPYGGSLRNISNLPARFTIRPLWPRSMWLQLPVSLPLELILRPVNVLHLNTVSPPVCPVPFVLTLNDLDFLLNPDFYPKAIHFRLSQLVPSSARRARKVFTASQFSKQCIMELLGLPAETIVVLYQGINPAHRVIEDPNLHRQIRSKYDLQGSYILYVGKLQTRKNIVRLLKALYILQREMHLDHKLVLVGAKSFSFSEILATIKSLDLEHEIRILGHVPLEDLVLLYNAADLFVFPSLSEGFGIPPIEAMACGTPVVTSNVTSLPEVVGDAAVTVDPQNVEEIARAIHRVLTTEQLKKELRERGLKRCTMFSDRRMAEQALEVYEEVARTKPT